MSTGNLIYMKNLIHFKKYRELEQAGKNIYIIRSKEKKHVLVANQKI